jgi:hypothetical protein
MLGSGHLYVLQSQNDPTIVKIGMTRASPTLRAIQVSAEYGAGSYSVLRSWEVGNPEWFEAMIHRRFHASRISLGKELFRVSLRDVEAAIEEISRNTGAGSSPSMFQEMIARPHSQPIPIARRSLRASIELIRRRIRLRIRRLFDTG